MAKITAWLVTLIGVILILELLGVNGDPINTIFAWVIALAVLVIGVAKLIRNYSGKSK